MKPTRLRKQTEQLAGCVWPPRFVVKVRAEGAGLLTRNDLLAFWDESPIAP